MSGASQAAISVDSVSKSFILRRNRTGSLKERLSLGRLNSKGAALTEEFWALRDVSFAVQPGQSVGIVGHNGSGKSTMLKILTGIMKPTHGQVRVRGRIGALIEVGAGFHPDLSGRENIFLNGSILGLSRREVAAKFDEIVAFAGLERFVDTPVKRYSSGMYMRLGFSIAVHTNPDVLLIDEVLAVGDTLFQRKCLRRLEQFVAEGGAAIFVSHAMAQVSDLCKTCVWLDHGQARFIGPTSDAIDQYMAVVTEREDTEFKREHPEEWAALQAAKSVEEEIQARELTEAENEEAERITAQQAENNKTSERDPARSRVLGATLRDSRGMASHCIRPGEPIRIEIAYQFKRQMPDPIFGVDIYREDGLHMFTTSNFDPKVSLRGLPASGFLRLRIDSLNFGAGSYRVNVNLFAQCSTPKWFESPEDQLPDALLFDVASDTVTHGCVNLITGWELPDRLEIDELLSDRSADAIFPEAPQLLELSA